MWISRVVIGTIAGLVLVACDAQGEEDRHLDCSPVAKERAIAAERIVACTQVLTTLSLNREVRAETLRNRANLYLVVREYQKAVVDSSAALHLTPDDNQTAFVRAAAEMRIGKMLDALSDLDAILGRDARDVPALYTRAEVHLALDQTDRARADIDLAIGLASIMRGAFFSAPQFIAYYLYPTRAKILASEGNYVEANQILDAAVQIEPEVLGKRCELGARWAHDLDRALADCNRFLQQKPNANTSPRAIVYYRLGDFPKAIIDCDHDLQDDPREPMSLYIRGLARVRSGSREEGLTDIAAAKSVAAGDIAIYEREGLKL